MKTVQYNRITRCILSALSLCLLCAAMAALTYPFYNAPSTHSLKFPSGLNVNKERPASRELQLFGYLRLIHMQSQGRWQGHLLKAPEWQAADADFAVTQLSQIAAWMPESSYPLFVAIELLGEWGTQVEQRKSVEWAVQHASNTIMLHWRWIVEAIWIARHRWHDLPTARRYASYLQNQKGVPSWAQSLGVWICEEQHDYQAAEVWIGSLLKAGIVQEDSELSFLNERLEELKNSKNKPK
ncbi:MAG: hypothetical protein V4525_13805 [Pseudomonadota bacterium]